MNEKRQRLTARERRKQILESTYKLIAAHGFKSVSTRMIAGEAGINEALIFKYFDNKSNLLTALVESIKMVRPEHNTGLPENEKKFFDTLKKFELFFFNINCQDPTILKIILHAVLENYPVPEEFDIKIKGSLLNWIKNSIKKGKQEWGFDPAVNETEAICLYMGGLIYYVLETAVLKLVKRPAATERFTELFFKMLK